ncbi:MAG: flagellar hook-length control protein FliK [Oscillospiraceae bacterium]
MDISGILNIGTDIIDPGFGMADSGSASDISFNDILGSAITAETPVTDVPQEIDIEEDTADDSTFSQLVSELAQDVSKADKSVIDAAIKMMLSAGNAAERFMYGSSDSALQNDEEKSTDVITILSDMIKLVNSQGGDENVSEEETGLSLTLGDIASLLKKGLSEGMTAEELSDEMKRLVQNDDTDLSALANAAVSMMEMMPVSIEPEIPDELQFGSAAKAASVTEVLSSDAPPAQKAETIVSIFENKTELNDLPSFESFYDSLKLAFSGKTDAEMPDASFAAIRKTAAFARINDVSAQIRVITGSDDESVVQTAAIAAVNNVLADIIPDAEIPSDPVEVYKELADFAVRQITQSISENVQNDPIHELVVVLKPENLGEVAVKVTTDTSGAVSIVLAASNEEVGRALAANSAALSESFAKQNISVENINVVAPSEAASYMGLDFSNRGFDRRNGDASQSGNTNNSRVSGISTAEDEAESGVTAARKLLKEAKLWLTA